MDIVSSPKDDWAQRSDKLGLALGSLRAFHQLGWRCTKTAIGEVRASFGARISHFSRLRSTSVFLDRFKLLRHPSARARPHASCPTRNRRPASGRRDKTCSGQTSKLIGIDIFFRPSRRRRRVRCEARRKTALWPARRLDASRHIPGQAATARKAAPVRYQCPILRRAVRRRPRRIHVEIVRRSDQANGFVVLPKRWFVERTLAWLNSCRGLAKDWENRNERALAFLRLASIRRMLGKLCASS